jgi:hypothetical protein
MRQTICHPIPLHDDTGYMAQLVLPRDLTQPECDRLCALLHALVGPQVHEDELPIMTDEEYAAWFALSYVPDGVGCRMGPA